MKIKLKNMSEEQKKQAACLLKKLSIMLCVAVLIMLVVELAFNFKRIRLGKEGRKTTQIEDEDIVFVGFEKKGDAYVTTGKQNKIILNKKSDYTYKLSYDCSSGRDFQAVIAVCETPAGDKNPRYFEKTDRNNLCIYHSEEVLDASFDHLEISFIYFNEASKQYEYISDLTVSNFSYKNAIDFNGRRMWIVFVFVIIVMSLIYFGEILVRRIELGFAAVALGIGLVMVFGFPAYKVTWDEEAHFISSYQMELSKDVIITPEVSYYSDANRVASLYYPMAECEFGQFKEFINNSRIYDKSDADNYVVKSGPRRLSDVGHIACSIGMNIAKLFRMPLWWVYVLGKLTNLLMYVGIVYLAIRHMRIGKGVMTVVALMPTTLFQASVLSYDATANAFMFLAMSYLLTAIVDKENVFDWKQCAIVVAGIAVASCVRIVYAPMFLLILFVPRAHFDSKRAWAIIKGGLLLACAIGALGLLYIAANSSGIEGDIRGGAVNVSEQLSFILHNPVMYGRMVVVYMWDWMGAFTLGNDVLGQFAHLRYFPFNYVFYVVMLFFIFTDTTNIDLKPLTRVGIGAILVGTAIGIWTSMYVFYTPVGVDYISGVQARYFIPLLIPLYALFNIKHIQNNIPKRIYHTLCIIFPAFITSGMLVVLMSMLSK